MIVTSETPFTKMEKQEQVKFVTRFLESLNPDYREVIILREYQNLSYEEIAAVTRSTISAVKSRLFKARRKLARSMEKAMLASELRFQQVEPGDVAGTTLRIN